MPTAALYTLLFAIAFWTYTTLWPQAPVMTSDSGGYLAVASDFRDFRIDYLHYRPPGYPLLLLLTASSEAPSRTLFFLSLLLHFASIWILASVLYATGLTEMMLSLFSIILLLPPYVEHAAYVMTENLAGFLLAVSFGSFVLWSHCGKTIWLFISALAIGYAGLTRPTYQALAFAMTASLFAISVPSGWSPVIRKHTLKASVILICASMLLIAGYGFLNFLKFGHFGLSLIVPVDSATLSTRTVRIVERLPDEYAPVREALIKARDAALVERGSQHTGYGYISSPGVIQELADITGLQGSQLAKYLLRINLLLIRKAPLEYLSDVSSAFTGYWFPASTAVANMNSRFLQLLWGSIHFCLMAIFALTLVVFVGGLPHMLAYKRFAARSDSALLNELALSQLQSSVYILAGTIVLYTALISSFCETGQPRYRVPTDGLIILMIFLSIAWYRRSVRCARMVTDK